MTKGFVPLTLAGLLGLLCGALLIQFSLWQVNVGIYLFFSASFFILIGSSFLKPQSVFLSLVNVLFFLGFWAKTTIHIVQGTNFAEAAGKPSLAHLDQAMMESAVFALLLTSFELGLRFQFVRLRRSLRSGVDTFLAAASDSGWLSSIIVTLIVVLLAVVNWNIGFLRVGLASATHVPAPFSILFSWVLGPGAATTLFYFVRKKMNIANALSVSAAMAAIGITTLSRNSLMYFALPIAYIVMSQYKQVVRGILFASFTASVFAYSMIRISQLRMDVTDSFPERESFADMSRTKTQMKELFMDRWIGIEGLLVATANRSDERFLNLIQEDARKNPTSIYRDLAGSDYPIPGKFLYYTFPGPIGMIAFANTLGFQLLGICTFLVLLSVLYFSVELIFKDSQKYVVAWWMASNLTQISLFPKYNTCIIFIYLSLMIFLTLALNRIASMRPEILWEGHRE